MEEKRAYLAKAQESLACAESEFAAGRYNTAARNVYYAMFQAAVAALLNEGVKPSRRWEHDFVHSRFSGLLVYRRKVYPSRFRHHLLEALTLRHRADYSPHPVDRRHVETYLTEGEELLHLIEERIE